MSLWAVLLTGLVVGGASCAAVQGGLLAGVMARRSQGAVTVPARVQRVTISATPGGYSPSKVRVRAGIPTTVTFHSTGSGCTNVVVIPTLGKQLGLSPKANKDVDLGTLQPGQLRWTCGMGMYSGTMEVIA